LAELQILLNGYEVGNLSVFSWLEDEGVLLAIQEHIASVGENLTSLSLAQAVTEYLKEEEMSGEVDGVETVIRGEDSGALKRSISERTARNRLNKLGFKWKDVQKMFTLMDMRGMMWYAIGKRYFYQKYNGF